MADITNCPTIRMPPSFRGVTPRPLGTAGCPMGILRLLCQAPGRTRTDATPRIVVLLYLC